MGDRDTRRVLQIGGLLIYREIPGVLAETAVWVCLDSEGFMYMADSLAGLLRVVATPWRQDKHLVG